MGHYRIFELRTEKDFQEDDRHLFEENYETFPPHAVSGLCDYWNLDSDDSGERESSLEMFASRYKPAPLSAVGDTCFVTVRGNDDMDEFSCFKVGDAFLEYFRSKTDQTLNKIKKLTKHPFSYQAKQEVLHNIRFELEDYHGHRFFIPSISRYELFNELEILDFLQDNLGLNLYIGGTADYHA